LLRPSLQLDWRSSAKSKYRVLDRLKMLLK
jgi:hypothetical protein